MAIAFDAVTLGAASAASSTSVTFSHTVGSGSDRFLIVDTSTYNFTGTPSPTVTYNGVSMTSVAVNVVIYSINNWRSHQHYLVAPATGTNNVVVTAASGNGILRGLASSYTGVDQTSPVLTSNTGAGGDTGNTMNISLTTSVAGWWFISGGNVDANWTAGANTATIRVANGTVGCADSNGDIAPTTGNAQLSHAGSRGYGGVALAFKEASAGFTPNPLMHMRMMAGGMV